MVHARSTLKRERVFSVKMDLEKKSIEELKRAFADLRDEFKAALENANKWQPYKRGLDGRDLSTEGTESIIPRHRTKRNLIALK